MKSYWPLIVAIIVACTMVVTVERDPHRDVKISLDQRITEIVLDYNKRCAHDMLAPMVDVVAIDPSLNAMADPKTWTVLFSSQRIKEGDIEYLLRSTAVHEVAHLVVFDLTGKYTDDHGPDFREALDFLEGRRQTCPTGNPG